MKLFVEGGGDSNELRTRCREGFRSFLQRAGVQRLPRIVASGSRNAAFQDFCTELGQNGSAWLLVDSEDPVEGEFRNPWQHLQDRDGWAKPSNAKDSNCHLMVVCMEAWFLADKSNLQLYYGQGFRAEALPRNPDIEKIVKPTLFSGLSAATKDTKKGEYSKGDHSFRILKMIEPVVVCEALPWAKRFIDTLKG